VGCAFYYGFLNVEFFVLIIALSFGFTIIYSFICLLIEEMTFRKYPSFRSLTILLLCNFIENIGYRQMTLYWRLKGFVAFFKNFKNVRRETQKNNERVDKCVREDIQSNESVIDSLNLDPK
jgi:hypothetical protein